MQPKAANFPVARNARTEQKDDTYVCRTPFSFKCYTQSVGGQIFTSALAILSFPKHVFFLQNIDFLAELADLLSFTENRWVVLNKWALWNRELGRSK